MAAPRVVLDCRWLPIGGAGRLTELLLRGLSQLQPETTWILWGPPSAHDFAWAGSEVVVTRNDPRRMRGQRDWFRVPAADTVVFMHEMRPLRPVPSITMILDTIPLRFGRTPVVRLSKKAFLRAVSRLSRHVITISDYSRRCIQRDLHLAHDRISVVRPPVDADLVARVEVLRRTLPPAPDLALYVGNFLPHKNLPRLIQAFGRTEFREAGGRLLLVGGSADEVRKLSARLTERERSFVEARGWCSQPELERLLATSLFLVQPSLEEGFGLPAWEALACGLPLCVSQGGSLPEIAGDAVEHFPPRSVERMAAAIDACAARARLGPVPWARLPSAPSVRDFAEQFEEIVQRTLAAAKRDAVR